MTEKKCTPLTHFGWEHQDPADIWPKKRFLTPPVPKSKEARSIRAKKRSSRSHFQLSGETQSRPLKWWNNYAFYAFNAERFITT